MSTGDMVHGLLNVPTEDEPSVASEKGSAARSDSNALLDRYKALYEENGRIYRYFLDWRHRVLVRFAVSVGVVVYLAKEILETSPNASQDPLPNGYAAPLFFFLSISAVFCFFMDRKNKRMLEAAEEAGRHLEGSIAPGGFSRYFFMVQADDNRGWLTYNTILAVLYILAAITGFTAGMAVAINHIKVSLIP